MLNTLFSFAIPLNVIPEAVGALHNICKAKAPTVDKGKEISAAWALRLLDLCEKGLRTCFEDEPDLLTDDPTLIQKQLVCIGELAILEFNKDDDKVRSRDDEKVFMSNPYADCTLRTMMS